MKLTDPPFDPDNIERQLTHAATQLLFSLCPEVEAAGAARQRRVMTAIQSQLAATVANMRADIKIAECLGPAAFQHAVLNLAFQGLQAFRSSNTVSASRRLTSPGKILPAPRTHRRSSCAAAAQSR